MAVLLRSSHLGCRHRWLVVFRHPFFRFCVGVDHYLRVSTGKAAGKRKRAKNGNSKKLIHSRGSTYLQINRIPARDLIFVRTRFPLRGRKQVKDEKPPAWIPTK